MNNKKCLMSLSALMIIIFHLWINVTNYNIENFIRYIFYIGVDIFFFISAVSLSNKKIEYKSFIKNRFINIYLKFIIFLFIASIYKSFKIEKIIKSFLCIELLYKGGGAFLWFIPSIMVLYIIIPLIKKLDDKYKIITPILIFLSWCIFTIIMSIYNINNNAFIFTNRLPIFFLGYYISKYNLISKLKSNKIIYVILSIILIVIGSFISYKCYINHTSFKYINEVFYIINIPLIIGIILLFDLIPKNKVCDYIGTSTLELYGLQMIFGTFIAGKVYSIISIPIVANIITITLFTLISHVMYKIFETIKTLLNKKSISLN